MSGHPTISASLGSAPFVPTAASGASYDPRSGGLPTAVDVRSVVPSFNVAQHDG